MRYRHLPGEWPWSFMAEQHICIKGSQVSFALSLKNTDDTAMPAGVGLHPYFPNLETASLQFNSSGVWNCGNDILPSAWVKTPRKWDFSQVKRLRGLEIDNCFTGWDGQAKIKWLDQPLQAHIQTNAETPFAVLYTNPTDNYVCFEPVSHMNNGMNWENTEYYTGVKTLQPGETLRAVMHITISKNIADSHTTLRADRQT